MPLFGLAIVPLAVILVLLVVACVLYRQRRSLSRVVARHAALPSRSWRVVAAGGTQWLERPYGTHGAHDRVNISESVHIRLVGPGSEHLLLGTVALGDEDYEEQIRAAIARGEERALTLNALLTP